MSKGSGEGRPRRKTRRLLSRPAVLQGYRVGSIRWQAGRDAEVCHVGFSIAHQPGNTPLARLIRTMLVSAAFALTLVVGCIILLVSLADIQASNVCQANVALSAVIPDAVASLSQARIVPLPTPSITPRYVGYFWRRIIRLALVGFNNWCLVFLRGSILHLILLHAASVEQHQKRGATTQPCHRSCGVLPSCVLHSDPLSLKVGRLIIPKRVCLSAEASVCYT